MAPVLIYSLKTAIVIVCFSVISNLIFNPTVRSQKIQSHPSRTRARIRSICMHLDETGPWLLSQARFGPRLDGGSNAITCAGEVVLASKTTIFEAKSYSISAWSKMQMLDLIQSGRINLLWASGWSNFRQQNWPTHATVNSIYLYSVIFLSLLHRWARIIINHEIGITLGY